MRIISFITNTAIIYKILNHLGLWKKHSSRDPPVNSETLELVYEPYYDDLHDYEESFITIN